MSKWYDYNHLDNEGMDVIQTFDGGYLFLVNTYISFDYSTTLFKTDYLGNIVWQKVYNRKNTGGAVITSYEVKQTKDSGFVFCGDSGGDSAFLIKTNFNGDLSSGNWDQSNGNTFESQFSFGFGKYKIEFYRKDEYNPGVWLFSDFVYIDYSDAGRISGLPEPYGDMYDIRIDYFSKDTITFQHAVLSIFRAGV